MPSYSMEKIQLTDVRYSFATAISADGIKVSGECYSNSLTPPYRNFLKDGSGAQILSNFGTEFRYAKGINNSTVLVNDHYLSPSLGRSHKRTGAAAPTQLEPGSAQHTNVSAINNNGIAVGSFQIQDVEGIYACAWDTNNFLYTLQGDVYYSQAYDVSDDDKAVGYTYTEVMEHACYWDITDLEVPVHVDIHDDGICGNWSMAYCISPTSGIIVGQCGSGIFKWTAAGGMEILTNDPQYDHRIGGVNDDGDMVGYGRSVEGSNWVYIAADNTFYNFNRDELIQWEPGFQFIVGSAESDISNNGKICIAAYREYSGDTGTRAIILTPQ